MSITTTAPATKITAGDIAALPVGAKIKTKSGFTATRTKDGFTVLGSEFTVNHIKTTSIPAGGAEYLNPRLAVGTRVKIVDERYTSSPVGLYVGKFGEVTKNDRAYEYGKVIHPYIVRLEDGGATYAAEVQAAPKPVEPWAFTETVVTVAKGKITGNANAPKGSLVRLVNKYQTHQPGDVFEVVRHDYDILVGKNVKTGKTVEGFQERFEVIEDRKVTLVPVSGKFKAGDLARVLPNQGTSSVKTGDVIEVTGAYGGYIYGVNKRTGSFIDLYAKRFERVARIEDTVIPKVAVGSEVEVKASVGGFTKGQRVKATHVAAGGDIKARPNDYAVQEWLYGGEYDVARILKSEVPAPAKPAKGEVEIGAYIGDAEGLAALPNGSVITPLSPSEKHNGFVKKGNQWFHVSAGYSATTWVGSYGLKGKSSEKAANQRGFLLAHYAG